MIFLYIIFLLVVSYKENRQLRHLSFLVTAMLLSVRPDDVPDTDNYIRIFENPFDPMENGWGDIGYSILNYFCHDLLSLNFSLFFFLLIFLLLELWYISTKRIFPCEKYGILFLFFMTYFGLFYMGITIRNGIALIICYLAFSLKVLNTKKKSYWAVLIIIFGATFHKTAILFLLVLPLLKFDLKKEWKYAIILLSLALTQLSKVSIVGNVINFISIYTNQFDKYNLGDTVDGPVKIFSVTFIYELLITMAAVYFHRFVSERKLHVYNMFSNLMLVGFFLQCLLWQVPSITRLSRMFFFYSFVIFYAIIFCNDKLSSAKKNRYAFLVAILNFGVLCYTESTILNF